MEREKEQEITPEISQEVVNLLGKHAIYANEVYRYLADEKNMSNEEIETRFLDKLLSENQDWTKSLDGKWIFNPIEHRAEYREL